MNRRNQFITVMIFFLVLGCGNAVPRPAPPDAQELPQPADPETRSIGDEVAGDNPMVHQAGMQIVDPDGNPLKLRGVVLEGWLQWSGHVWGLGFISETEIMNKLTQLAGPEEAQTFRTGVYDNFITERDIEMMADLGFNVVRVPINHHVLESATGVVDDTAVGWTYLDRLLEWCERHAVYVVLDLQSAPGGQSRIFVADPDPEKLWQSEENKERTAVLWQAIANRYKDETIIAGYDLLNEPGFPNSAELVKLYSRIIAAIREVDPYHMIILEGNTAATDFSLFSQPLSANQTYSFHTYNLLTDKIYEEEMQALVNLAEAQNVPLWNGEFGAHNAEWVAATMALFEDLDNHVSGWIFWPWKRVPQNNPQRYRFLTEIQTTAAWDAVRTAVTAPNNPNNAITPETAVQGMNEFLTSIKAEELVLDEEMGNILANFEK